MHRAHTLVIRGGTVVDGTGGDPFAADVALDGSRIAAIGRGLGRGAEEIDARGKLVTPGFVDNHTHYDAQAAWSNHMTPSSWNGVTTAMMGNCGVGFAPCRPDQRQMLRSASPTAGSSPPAPRRISTSSTTNDSAGGRRLIQRTTGYDATVLSGVPVYRGGEATGSLPARLVRSRG